MEIELQVKENGDRLDRWLSKQLSDLSRSRIQKLIEEGNVSLNERVCTEKKTTVRLGDRLHLTIPPARLEELQPEEISLDILYEDETLIIINKPAGLVVHPAPGHAGGTLVNALLFHCQDLAGIGGVRRPGIVHRLDKDTTGALMVAKTDSAYRHLQAQLKSKTAKRIYLGIVYGAPATESGSIDLPIGRHPIDRKKMAVVPLEKGGRSAITRWQVVERLGNYTLLQFQLLTGRTHQIRVHAAQIGHPLVGDRVYGSGRNIGVNLPGQALHAWKLIIEHPLSGETIVSIAQIPAHFHKLLEILRKRANF